MQYCDYISSHNARREREQQLANAYNQKPQGQRVQNLWMHSIEKNKNYRPEPTALIGIALALIVLGIVLFLIYR